MASYNDLAQDATHASLQDAVFLCGLRCAAEVNLTQHRIGRVATTPVDILTELRCEIPGETTSKVTLYPNHIEKEHTLASRVVARSRWFAASDDPCLAVWFTVENGLVATYRFEVRCTAVYNVNYLSKFRIYPNDIARLADGYLMVHDTRYGSLQAFTATSPAWDHCTIEPFDHGGDSVRATWMTYVDVPPQSTANIILGLGGSDREGHAADAVRALIADPARAFEQTIAAWERYATRGATITTPHVNINQFHALSKLWGYKDTRLLPLGAPFDRQTNANADLAMLTASPDYHGSFANDNAQSCWEYGALGPDFYPILDNTLDALYHYGTPESVEVDPINATGQPWCSPLRIGERPQWVMGACFLILWSGQYVDRYWPRIQEVLARFASDDRDGDMLDDYSSSTYPEQPDPGPFRHEMLYANTFWFAAFHDAAKVAGLVGDTTRAEAYERSAQRIAEAVELAFGCDFGYASWLDATHAQHPHRGHNIVLPLQYGMASPERAERAFQTLLSPPLWSNDGPLAIEPGYPLEGAAHAWAFTRWNLVHALYRYGRTEQATSLLLRWAAQEATLFYQAPEGFPTITGVTGKGYSWTAGRAQRALLCGLFGLDLQADGFSLAPRLPTDWPAMELRGLPFRGATYDIRVEHGDHFEAYVGAVKVRDLHIPAPADSDHHRVVVRLPG